MIPFLSSRFGSVGRSIVRRFFLFVDTFPVNALSRIRRRMDGCVSRSRRAKTDGDDARRDARWIALPSLFLFLSLSSSSPRRRVLVVALSRAPSTPRTHKANPIPRAVGRSRSVAVGRGRGPTTRGVSRVATRRSIHRSIGPTGRSAPARDGTAARARVGVRTSGRSVGRTFERRTRGRTRDEMNAATRREGRGSRGGMPNPTPYIPSSAVCRVRFMGNGVGCVWGWGWTSVVPGDGVVVWW